VFRFQKFRRQFVFKLLDITVNRVLRRLFGPKGDEVTGECRKLHNEELNDLYSSPNIVREIKSRKKIGGGAWSAYV